MLYSKTFDIRRQIELMPSRAKANYDKLIEISKDATERLIQLEKDKSILQVQNEKLTDEQRVNILKEFQIYLCGHISLHDYPSVDRGEWAAYKWITQWCGGEMCQRVKPINR